MVYVAIRHRVLSLPWKDRNPKDKDHERIKGNSGVNRRVSPANNQSLIKEKSWTPEIEGREYTEKQKIKKVLLLAI